MRSTSCIGMAASLYRAVRGSGGAIRMEPLHWFVLWLVGTVLILFAFDGVDTQNCILFASSPSTTKEQLSWARGTGLVLLRHTVNRIAENWICPSRLSSVAYEGRFPCLIIFAARYRTS
ncbi:hypothetical protein BX666DRAFT_1907624 [Dichotomocladium elegans]|nr:hypothetical protein BX666DRAFT_1907624 [Dichotomocladium elegans]